MSDSKTTRKKASNLLKKVVDGVWLIGLFTDGTETKMLIPKNLEVPIERGQDLKVLYITNGTAKIPMLQGPMTCQHGDSGCCGSDCSNYVYILTARLIQLVRAAK
jgi:hypothetical protein